MAQVVTFQLSANAELAQRSGVKKKRKNLCTHRPSAQYSLKTYSIGEKMGCEQQNTDWQELHRVIIEPCEEVAETTPRKQCLMRCGRKFYYVYEDDGSLVEDQH